MLALHGLVHGSKGYLCSLGGHNGSNILIDQEMDEQKPHSRASHDAVAGSDTSGLNPCNLATDLQSKEKCATEAIQVATLGHEVYK